MKNLVAQLTAGQTNPNFIRRATDAAKRIVLEQSTLITDLDRTLMEKKAELDVLLDLGPESSDSLRPVDKDFDPKGLVVSIQRLKVEILNLEVEHTVAKKTLEDFNAEDANTATAIA